MLSCRCSATGLDGDEDGCRIVVGDAGVSGLSEVPQLEQKFELAWLVCPHERHARDRWAPQLAQNLLLSGTSALQDGQSIDELHDAKKHGTLRQENA